MKDTIYIVFNRGGIRSLTKRTKNTTLPPNTYLVELNLEVPNEFFENQIPRLDVKLSAENIIVPEIKITPVKKIIEQKQEELKTPIEKFFGEIT